MKKQAEDECGRKIILELTLSSSSGVRVDFVVRVAAEISTAVYACISSKRVSVMAAV